MLLRRPWCSPEKLPAVVEDLQRWHFGSCHFAITVLDDFAAETENQHVDVLVSDDTCMTHVGRVRQCLCL